VHLVGFTIETVNHCYIDIKNGAKRRRVTRVLNFFLRLGRVNKMSTPHRNGEL